MTTWTRDLITSLIGLWIVIGVFIDGWAHVNLIDAIETFFTPWHATFYSGLAVFFAWLGLVWLGERRFPPGYKAGAAGAAIFAAGGAFDMFWHTLLGIENSIDALLSPPHIILLSGVLLMGTTAWRSQRTESASTTLPELISLTSVVMICGFFLNFLSPFRWAAPTLPYTENQDEDVVIQWIGGLIVFTALFLIPVLWQLRDRRYRTGTLAVFTLGTGLGVAQAMSAGWDKPLLFAGVAGAVIGAIVGEVLLAASPWRTWTYGLPIVMGVTGLAIWSGQLAAYSIAGTLAWPAALWAGSLLFAAGVGLALGAVAWQPATPVPQPPLPPAEDPAVAAAAPPPAVAVTTKAA